MLDLQAQQFHIGNDLRNNIQMKSKTIESFYCCCLSITRPIIPQLGFYINTEI